MDDAEEDEEKDKEEDQEEGDEEDMLTNVKEKGGMVAMVVDVGVMDVEGSGCW